MTQIMNTNEKTLAELQRDSGADMPLHGNNPDYIATNDLPKLDIYEIKALRRFAETAEDDGTYDLSKPMLDSLSKAGALRNIGFGRYELTAFGEYLLTTPISAHNENNCWL
jgi:hypothetical protein